MLRAATERYTIALRMALQVRGFGVGKKKKKKSKNPIWEADEQSKPRALLTKTNKQTSSQS